MTYLADHQFELLASADDIDGYVFGAGQSVGIDQEGFIPASGDWITQDAQSSSRGSTAFGKDALGAGSYAFESFIDQTSEADARAVLSDMARAWRNESVSRQYGTVAALRYVFGGVTRRVYGRPRRFAPIVNNMVLNGFIAVSHDFACSDANSYDDVESMVSMTFSGSTIQDVGMTFPVTFPITPKAISMDPSGQLVVGGDVRTYPVIRLNGPWISPIVKTDSWTLSLPLLSMGVNQWVEIDTRPWAMTVLDQDGISRGGLLARKTYLDDIFLEPNTRPAIQLGGNSANGTATCSIRWRNAYSLV